MFNRKNPDEIQNWSCVYETTTEYDANLAKSYLESRGLVTRIISKRDSAFNLNVGDLAVIFLYVPDNEEAQAREAIREWEGNDSETEDDENEKEAE